MIFNEACLNNYVNLQSTRIQSSDQSFHDCYHVSLPLPLCNPRAALLTNPSLRTDYTAHPTGQNFPFPSHTPESFFSCTALAGGRLPGASCSQAWVRGQKDKNLTLLTANSSRPPPKCTWFLSRPAAHCLWVPKHVPNLGCSTSSIPAYSFVQSVFSQGIDTGKAHPQDCSRYKILEFPWTSVAMLFPHLEGLKGLTLPQSTKLPLQEAVQPHLFPGPPSHQKTPVTTAMG